MFVVDGPGVELRLKRKHAALKGRNEEQTASLKTALLHRARDGPIPPEEDGHFDFIALLEDASGFILSAAPARVKDGVTGRAGHVQCCASLVVAAQLQTWESSMTNSESRFRCPACGFAVYNRRVARCESCSAALPNELRFTPAELKTIEAEHERNEKVRQQLAREAAEHEALEAERRRLHGTIGGSC